MNSAKVEPQNQKNDPKDELLKNGPIHQRECRDLLCCLIFVAAFISCIYFFAFGIANGQPSRLFAIYDKSGSPCGLDGQSDRKYLFFYAPAKGYTTQTTCVSSCPESTSDSTIDCNIAAMPSKANCNQNCPSISNANSFDDNTVCYYQTQKFLSKACIPTADALKSLSSGVEEQINDLLRSSTLTQWMTDINNSKAVIGGSVAMAFGIGFVYMIFLRFFAGIFVWISIALYFVFIFVLAGLSYKKSKEISDYLDKHDNVETGNYTTNNKNGYMALSIIMWIFGFLCLIGFFCMFNKIRQAIAIIKTTTQYISDVWSSLLVPPVFTVLVALWWLTWLLGYVYLYAVDETGLIKKSSSSMFAGVKHSSHVTKLLWSYLFIGLWVNAFIQAVCQFILASAACIWYFSQGQSGQQHFPVKMSIYRAFRYHIGSLAFGALLLAIIQFIRLILQYIEQQAKKAGAGNNKCTQCLIKCMQCYAACFERFIKFLNRNAYIQIALKGENFCVAAKDAMTLIWSNAAKFALVNGIGGAFIFLGKIFICCSTTFFCFLILTTLEPYKTEVDSFVLPCIIIFFISYAISVIFMCVYGMGMSAILVCFLWDEKMFGNKCPPHAPPLLQEFFDKNEKK